MSDPVAQFIGAISAAGIAPPRIVTPDGKLHRFASNGDARDKAGWYIFHLDGVPAGAFGDFRSGLGQTWRADMDRKLSPQELTDCKARVESMRRQREAENAKVKAEARLEAIEIWDAAGPAPGDHSYLARKCVKPHGLRVHEGRLVVPMLDDQGTLHSLHFIAADGSKRFLTGGRVAGCFYQIGEPRGVICIGEGFATMATVHEAAGHAAVAAINRSSLLAVAQSFQRRFPAAKIVLCADDDWMREGNPGLTDARTAAAAVGGVVAVPEFGEGRGEKDTDFNDMARSASRDAVRAGLRKAEKANDAINEDRTGVHLEDFVAYMPMHSYIFRPDGGMWPGTSVNARIPQEKGITASAWLDKNSPVEQMTWAPGEPQLIKDRLMAEGAWIDREGLTVFNLYRPPSAGQGNASRAKRWVDLVQAIYPEDVDHLIAWLSSVSAYETDWAV